MKIALAQTGSSAGDLKENITRHQQWIKLAADHHSDLILFPELSLTAYEPGLIEKLALEVDDPKLEIFQKLSDQYQLIICPGVPLRSPAGITISMLIFRPHVPKQIYAKKHLHADELPFFVAGRNTRMTIDHQPMLAPAICYEISVPEHAAAAARTGASFYLASVVKYPSALPAAFDRLAAIAKTYQMTVCMSNAVGGADGGVSGGKSSVWAPDGQLIGQLDQNGEGLLLYEAEHRRTEKIISPDFT